MPAQNQNQKSTLKEEKPEIQPVQTAKLEPLKTLLVWSAPERLFKKRTREFFTTVGTIVFLLVVVLLFLKEWFLIVTIIALMFVSYIMATVEPRKVKHKITTRGITTGGKSYRWNELGRFWFSQKYDQKMFLVENLVGFPGHLTFLLGETSQDQVKKILSQYLALEKPGKTWLDNAGDWLSRRIPLEK